jgi:hypothetical protein
VSTITVTAGGVKTVNDALEEVDAVVEALKDRADEVLKMLGMELERDGGRDRSRVVAAPAVKAAAVSVATKATKTVAKSAATKVAKKAAKRARKNAQKAARRAAAKAAVAVELVDAAKSVAERAPETLHVGKAGKRGRARRSSARALVIVGVATTAGVVVMWWRARAARIRELEAVENTPDEFGVVLERAELAGVIPTR